MEVVNEMISLSNILKNERIKRGLTQSNMAELLNLKRSTYSLYESGKREPDLQTIRNFSSILGVYMGDLITDWSKFSKEEINNDLTLDFTSNELSILQDYRTLNDNGKCEARKRVCELTKIPEYRKENDEETT